jgi:hypothetical protein
LTEFQGTFWELLCCAVLLCELETNVISKCMLMFRLGCRSDIAFERHESFLEFLAPPQIDIIWFLCYNCQPSGGKGGCLQQTLPKNTPQ